MKKFMIILISLFLLALTHPLAAAELVGTVFKGGVPTGNLLITVEGSNAETRTDAKGEYRLNVPDGKLVLIIRGQRFPVTVSPGGTRKDLRI